MLEHSLGDQVCRPVIRNLMYTIYVVTNLITLKRYVGLTKRIPAEKRWSDHVRRCNAGEQKVLYSSMRKHGIENFFFEKLESCESSEEASTAESKWISYYSSSSPDFGYNRTLGGERGQLTEDVKAKLSVLNSGERNPFYGRKHTAESLAKISEASKRNAGCNKGKFKPTAEHVEKMKAACADSWENNREERLMIAKLSWENDERRKNASDRMKERFEDPEARKLLSEASSRNMKERWKDPQFRAMMKEKSRMRRKKKDE